GPRGGGCGPRDRAGRQPLRARRAHRRARPDRPPPHQRRPRRAGADDPAAERVRRRLPGERRRGTPRARRLAALHHSAPRRALHAPLGPLILRTPLTFGGLLAPFCLAAAVVGAGAVFAQVGWSVNPELLLPDPGRISPSNGLKRIFSANGAMNLVKAVAKIAVVATVAYRVLLRTGAEAIGASGMMPAEILGFTGAGLRRLFLTMAVALAVLGG